MIFIKHGNYNTEKSTYFWHLYGILWVFHQLYTKSLKNQSCYTCLNQRTPLRISGYRSCELARGDGCPLQSLDGMARKTRGIHRPANKKPRSLLQENGVLSVLVMFPPAVI